MLVHVTGEYDYRYDVQQDEKEIIVLKLRALINKQVQACIRSYQCLIYMIDRKSLKIYDTLKGESKYGI